MLFLEIPLFIHLYLLYYRFDESNLVNFYTQILIFIIPIEIIFFSLCHLCSRQPLALILIILQNIQDKPLPEIILARTIDNSRHSIKLSSNSPRYNIQKMYISLIDHFSRAKKHILLVAKSLHEKGKKLMNGIITCFEKLGIYHEANNLFNQIMGDTIPSIFAETTLSNLKNTVRSQSINDLSI